MVKPEPVLPAEQPEETEAPGCDGSGGCHGGATHPLPVPPLLGVSWGPRGARGRPGAGGDPGFAPFLFPGRLVVPKEEAMPEGDGEEWGAAGELGGLEPGGSGEGTRRQCWHTANGVADPRCAPGAGP